MAEARALRAFLLSGLMRGLGAVAVLLTSFVIARIYPPAVAADFFFILTAAQIATPLLLLGLNGFLVRLAPRFSDPGARQIWLGRCLCAVTLPAAFCAAGMALLAAAGVAGAGLGWPAWLFILLLAPLTGFAGYTLQALGAVPQAIFVLQLLNTLLIALLALLAAALALPPAPARDLIFPLAGLTGLAISQLILHRAGLRGGLWPRAFRAPAQILQGERFGALAMIHAVYGVLILNLWLPQLVLYAFAAPQDYAFFSLAQRLAGLVVFFSIVVNFTLAPELAALCSQPGRGGGAARRMLLRSCRITGLMALPLVILLLLMPGQILGLFGTGYREGAFYLQIFALSQFVSVLSGASNTLLLMSGHARLLLQDLIAGLLLSIGLMVLAALAPGGADAGGTGFALAFGAGLSLQSLLSLRNAFSVLRAERAI